MSFWAAASKGRPFSAGLQHRGFIGRLTLEISCVRRVHQRLSQHAASASTARWALGTARGDPTGKLESKESPKPGVNELASNTEVLLKNIVWRNRICSGAAAIILAMLVQAVVFRYLASPVNDDDARAGHGLQGCRTVMMRVVPAGLKIKAFRLQDLGYAEGASGIAPEPVLLG